MAGYQASSQLSECMCCPVCMETYDNKSHMPKLLPCQHTFCQSCIAGATNKDRVPETLTCPMCRCSHDVPRQGFTANRAVLDIVDELLGMTTHEQDTTSQTARSLRCEQHANKEAVLVCVQCLHGVCLTCVKTNSHSHSGHQLLELDEALPMQQKTMKDKLAARKTVLQENISLLQSSACSSLELTKAEEDIKSIRDKIGGEVVSWADNQLLTLQQLKEKSLNQEHELSSDLDSFKAYDSDFTSVLQKLHKTENNNDQFLQSILSQERSGYNKSRYSERTQELLESIQSTLTSKESLQSKFLRRQVELDNVDVMAGEKRATGSMRPPDSNIPSPRVGSISHRSELLGQQVGQIFQPGNAGYFVPTMPNQQHFYHACQMGQVRPTPRWNTLTQGMAAGPRGQAPHPAVVGQMQAYPNLPVAGGQMRGARPTGPQQVQPGQQVVPGAGGMGPAMAARPITGSAVQPGQPQAQRAAAAGGVMNGVAAQKAAMAVMQAANVSSLAQAVVVQGQDPLTTTMFAAAQPQEQKQMLGERLYPLIQSMYPELAGRITGMLLELDNSELLHRLESRKSLKAKVEEAVAVLQAHQAKLLVGTPPSIVGDKAASPAVPSPARAEADSVKAE